MMYIRMGCYTVEVILFITQRYLHTITTSKILHTWFDTIIHHIYTNTTTQLKPKCPHNPEQPIASMPVCKMTTVQTTGFEILLKSIAYVLRYHHTPSVSISNKPKARNSWTRPLCRVTRCEALQRWPRLGSTEVWDSAAWYFRVALESVCLYDPMV